MSLTDDIKDYALDLGYCAVGITTADPFPQYEEALSARYEAYSWAIDDGMRLTQSVDPRNFLPAAKSVVVTLYDYFQNSFPPELTGKVGRLYQTRYYLPKRTTIRGARERLMREFLERNGCQVGPWRGVTSGVPHRLAAARAGLTRFGKNNFAFRRGIGSWIVIGTFVVDKELSYDAPTMSMDCPEGCRKCLDACPTGAILAPANMDPRRCIAFNSYVTTDSNPGMSGYISPEIRAKMGTWIFGCDVCQEVCPRNQSKLRASLPPDYFLLSRAAEFDLVSVLNLSDDYYARVIKPIMYSYIREKKYFQRNAAIALGNSGDPAAIPPLARAMTDPEEVVRAHSAWALGKIGGGRARDVLESARRGEVSEIVRQEIEAALLVV